MEFIVLLAQSVNLEIQKVYIVNYHDILNIRQVFTVMMNKKIDTVIETNDVKEDIEGPKVYI